MLPPAWALPKAAPPPDTKPPTLEKFSNQEEVALEKKDAAPVPEVVEKDSERAEPPSILDVEIISKQSKSEIFIISQRQCCW